MKKMNTALLATFVLTLGMTAGAWAAPATTANVSVDSPYYGYIEKLSAMGYLDTMPNGAKPYSRMQMAQWVVQAQDKAQTKPMPKYLSDEVEALAQYVAPEVATLRGEKAYDPVKLRSVSLTAAAQLSDTPRHSYSHIDRSHTTNAGWQTFGANRNGYKYGRDGNGILEAEISGNIGHETAIALRPRFSYDKDNDFSASLEEGYIKTRAGIWAFEAGKQAMTWGQGETGNLALGDNMRPLTTLQAHFIEPQKVGGFFRFLGQADVHLFYGFLEGDRRDRAAALGYKDYDDAGLIGIRADFSPTSYFTFGVSRLSMLGGDGNGLDSSDWGHWLYGRNDDADQDRWDDIAGGDFRLSLPGVTFYGELYGEDQSHYMPSKVAYRAGMYLPKLTHDGSWDMTLEMADTSDAWYGHQRFNNGWTYHDAIMGDAMGRDARKYYGAVRHYLPNETSIGLYAQRTEMERGMSIHPTVNEFGLTGQTKLGQDVYLNGIIGYANVENADFTVHTDHDKFATATIQWRY